jgi:hypothetical protein
MFASWVRLRWVDGAGTRAGGVRELQNVLCVGSRTIIKYVAMPRPTLGNEYCRSTFAEDESENTKNNKPRIWTRLSLRWDKKHRAHAMGDLLIPNSMRWTKVTCNMRTATSRAFDYYGELWSIWENNNNKMHTIRCASILNQFRMKLMKVNCNLKNILNKELEYYEEWRCVIHCQSTESISRLMNPKWNVIW